MAVIDQDNFSNISWHSEQNAESAASTAQVHLESNSSPEYARSGPDDGRPGDNAAGMEHDELNHSGGEILDCTVSDPHKENDGTKDAYVSYLITTNVRAVSLHNTILALGHCHLGLLQAKASPTMGFYKANIPFFFCHSYRPLFLPSRNPKPQYDDDSPISFFSTRSYAVTTRLAPSLRCRTSSEWNMCGATGSALTSPQGGHTRYSDSWLVWPFIRYCGKPTFSMPSWRAPTGMLPCAAGRSGGR